MASATYTLSLTAEERDHLLRLLEQSLSETHQEARRTEAPKLQEKLDVEEASLRSLLSKVRAHP